MLVDGDQPSAERTASLLHRCDGGHLAWGSRLGAGTPRRAARLSKYSPLRIDSATILNTALVGPPVSAAANALATSATWTSGTKLLPSQGTISVPVRSRSTVCSW